MDVKSTDTHAVSIKRKRDTSPSRRNPDFKGSYTSSYRGSAGGTAFVVTSNGNKVDRYVSRSHDRYRPPDTYIPTGPRSQVRDTRRPFQAPTTVDSRNLSTQFSGAVSQKSVTLPDNLGNTQKNSKIQKKGEIPKSVLRTGASSASATHRSQIALNSPQGLDIPKHNARRNVSSKIDTGVHQLKVIPKGKLAERSPGELANKDNLFPSDTFSTAGDDMITEGFSVSEHSLHKDNSLDM